jgi:hypothetical protein
MKKVMTVAAGALALTLMMAGSADAGRFACRGDFKKYCSNEEPGTDGAASCMRQHFDQLSDDCKAYVKEVKAEKDAEAAAKEKPQ